MAVEMVINSWFGHGAGNNMIKKKRMATNIDFLSQFKLKWLSQSIWLNSIHVLQLLIVIVGLGFFFLLILMNIQINKMSFIYFLLQNYYLFIF